MSIRAFNAVQETTAGPFDSFHDAFLWATRSVGGHRLPEDEYRAAFDDEGITNVSCSPDDAEDACIFDDTIHEPDEDGYVDW